MLYLIGLGVSPPETIPCSGAEAIRGCEIRLLDSYTTPLKEDELRQISEKLGAELAPRETLEDVNRITTLAKEKEVCVLIYGDPFLATTHQSLRVEALRRDIRVKTIYAAGFINALFGELGLHFYKLGSVSTLVEGDLGSAMYVYREVQRALQLGKHSVILLATKGSVTNTMAGLLEAERNYRGGIFTDERWLIAASRIGLGGETFASLRFKEALTTELEQPATIVLPAQLHFTEEEALRARGMRIFPVSEVISEEKMRASRIIKMIYEALLQFNEKERAKFKDLLENAEYYASDAESYLAQNEEALGLMQAAYAEGLLDSLRLLGLKEIKWPNSPP